ncbi:Kinase A anchor protein [Coniochaeta hoffmannii]|uniref:Kinase A anchor protein n=1 Tax=Coniochaeta hoffmannii TaxID=91930 RepID=A0AA38W3W6_9PEZI|nr:Kinase A anchor protein [Coniochaeta hoffmannii]
MPPKPFPTHFLCIPLVNATSRVQLSQSLASFSADVTAPDSFGLPQDAIRPVGTIHLTLGVCSFPKSEGLDRATELLKSLRLRGILDSARQQVAARTLPGDVPSVQEAYGKCPGQETDGKVSAQQAAAKEEGPQPLLITLRGLVSMQAPSKASVLYAQPLDEQGVLQLFCEKLRGVFVDEGLMQDEGRPLLLHATVANTIYVKNAPGEGGGNRGGSKAKRGRRGEKLTFDARPIMDRYEDQIWLKDFPVEKIALCRMGAKKVEVDGVVVDEAYEAVAEVGF